MADSQTPTGSWTSWNRLIRKLTQWCLSPGTRTSARRSASTNSRGEWTSTMMKMIRSCWHFTSSKNFIAHEKHSLAKPISILTQSFQTTSLLFSTSWPRTQHSRSLKMQDQSAAKSQWRRHSSSSTKSQCICHLTSYKHICRQCLLK